jgi:hypothetical protein
MSTANPKNLKVALIESCDWSDSDYARTAQAYVGGFVLVPTHFPAVLNDDQCMCYSTGLEISFDGEVFLPEDVFETEDEAHAVLGVREPHFSREYRQQVFKLAEMISLQVGRGGTTNTPEVALRKLCFGDSKKKDGDRGEIEELAELLPLTNENSNFHSLWKFLSEVADLVYYGLQSKGILPVNMLVDLIEACGCTTKCATTACLLKYASRVATNVTGYGKEYRDKREEHLFVDWIILAQGDGDFDPAQINSQMALEIIEAIKSHAREILSV